MEMNVAWYEVDDLDKAKRFYGETLGLEKVLEMDGWVEFSHAKDAPAIGLSRVGKLTNCGATVVLRVDDVDLTRNLLLKQGVKFEGDVQEIPGVVRLATFKDPAGNRLQLCQVLFDANSK
jgi:predicted enzyme related to lactoylglutathione lyase